jgi:hypothetical protein
MVDEDSPEQAGASVISSPVAGAGEDGGPQGVMVAEDASAAKVGCQGSGKKSHKMNAQSILCISMCPQSAPAIRNK